MMFSIISLYNSSIRPLKKLTDRSWRMIADYHKTNRVVTPIISVAELDMISLLKQINTASGTPYVAIDLVSMYFSTPCQ